MDFHFLFAKEKFMCLYPEIPTNTMQASLNRFKMQLQPTAKQSINLTNDMPVEICIHCTA